MGYSSACKAGTVEGEERSTSYRYPPQNRVMSISTRSDDFQRKVDSHVSALIESYRTLLKKGQVGETVEQHAALQINTAASNISFHSNALLDQILELRLAISVQQADELDGGGDNGLLDAEPK